MDNTASLVFTIGKFHPPHVGHIEILGGQVRSLATELETQGIFGSVDAIVFATNGKNKVQKLAQDMENIRNGKGMRKFFNPANDTFVDESGVKHQSKHFGKVSPETFLERIQERNHVNLKEVNDRPLHPEFKMNLLDKSFNGDSDEKKITVLTTQGLYAVFGQILTRYLSKKITNLNILMVAGDDRYESYTVLLQKWVAKTNLENTAIKINLIKGFGPIPGIVEAQNADLDRADLSGTNLRYLAHAAYDEMNSSSPPIDVENTAYGKEFKRLTGYPDVIDDNSGLSLTTLAINQIYENTPRGGRLKTRKRRRKWRKTKKGKKRHVKTKRRQNKRKNKSRRRN